MVNARLAPGTLSSSAIRMTTTVATPPTPPTPTPPTPPTRPGEIQRVDRGPLWPPIFGYIAFPFAALSILIALWSLAWPTISAMIEEANPGGHDDLAGGMRFYRTLDILLMLARVALAGWLFKIARGLVRRRPSSVRTLCTWAALKLALEVGVTALLYAQMYAHFGTRSDIPPEARVWSSVGVAAWTALTSIPIPALLLIWLLTPMARRDARQAPQNQPAAPPNT
jgi:hypothetical protein